MRIFDNVEVRQNLRLIMRERGKIVARRDGHNIFLNTGREWIARLICYSLFSPLTAEEDSRVRYMGVGIGGTRQLAPGVANSSPIGGDPPTGGPYVGTNVQVDTDPTVTRLERPVRVSGGSTAYPGVGGDRWVAQVQAPAVHDTAVDTTFVRVFSEADVSYPPFLSVPLSEVGLFIASADPEHYDNVPIAYDCFDTLSKTSAFELEVRWTIHIG
jgi:hypothetical protein